MKKLASLSLVAALAAGCTTDPYTGEQKVSKTGWGAGIGTAVGAASGALIGGDAKGAAIGAAAGAAVGGGVGYYMDRQEAEIRQQLEGTGVRVQRVGNDLKLIMPGNITFATDSSNIAPNFYPVLDSVGTVLRKFDETSIDIAGHTDSVGSDMYNQELSERRADSVASYLVRTGVSAGRIQSRGFGERYPVAPNDNEMGRSQNRRVEINIRPQG
ncbi:MAG: OmpA family protein [Gammaproteobacteria bacterium]